MQKWNFKTKILGNFSVFDYDKPKKGKLVKDNGTMVKIINIFCNFLLLPYPNWDWYNLKSFPSPWLFVVFSNYLFHSFCKNFRKTFSLDPELLSQDRELLSKNHIFLVSPYKIENYVTWKLKTRYCLEPFAAVTLKIQSKFCAVSFSNKVKFAITKYWKLLPHFAYCQV